MSIINSFSLLINYMRQKSSQNNADHIDKIDVFRVTYTIKHVIESASSNSYLKIGGGNNFIKQMINKSGQINFMAPQLNLSTHTTFGI